MRIFSATSMHAGKCCSSTLLAPLRICACWRILAPAHSLHTPYIFCVLCVRGEGLDSSFILRIHLSWIHHSTACCVLRTVRCGDSRGAQDGSVFKVGDLGVGRQMSNQTQVLLLAHSQHSLLYGTLQKCAASTARVTRHSSVCHSTAHRQHSAT